MRIPTEIMFCYNWPSINPRKDSFVLFDPKSNMIQKLCNISDIVPPIIVPDHFDSDRVIPHKIEYIRSCYAMLD